MKSTTLDTTEVKAGRKDRADLELKNLTLFFGALNS
jgi:hypothetical protein